jgi:hypothetical protein
MQSSTGSCIQALRHSRLHCKYDGIVQDTLNVSRPTPLT